MTYARNFSQGASVRAMRIQIEQLQQQLAAAHVQIERAERVAAARTRDAENACALLRQLRGVVCRP